MLLLNRCLLPLAPFLLAVGCSGSDVPTTYRVTGQVNLDGAPVEGATVSLIPAETTGRSASGVTDADGKFSVKTYIDPKNQPEGALPGDYSITVSKQETRAVAEGLDPEEAMAEFKKLGPPKHLLPKQYRAPNTSGFSIKVEDRAPDPLVLDLKK